MKSSTARVIITLTLGIFAGPLAAEAQQPAKIPRIGFLSVSLLLHVKAFRQGLRDLGYVEGQNIIIDFRSGEGRIEALADLATDLARLKVDIMVAAGSDAIRAAQQTTKTIPIVMAVAADPVGAGFVASLARPGGNITGLSSLGSGTSTKRLELLKEAVPKVARVAVLANPANPSHGPALKDLEGTARSLGIQLGVSQVRDPNALDDAFSTMTRTRAGALLVLPDTMFLSQRRRIRDLAAKSRLPDTYEWPEVVAAGGLMSYGASRAELYRRAATYVDKILKGAKPADLPVEQPTRFELVINMKTAKALGLTFPPSLLLRADQVIQ